MIQSFAEIRAALAAQQQQQNTPQDAQDTPKREDKPAKMVLTAEQVERLEQAQNAILNNCPDLKIVRAGSWLWATGNTRQHKGELLRQGWFWASKKAAWYFHLPEHKTRRRRGGEMPLERIFDKYTTTTQQHENESHVHN